MRFREFIRTVCLSALLFAWPSSEGAAQRLAGEAYSGRPYGIGRITVPLSPQDAQPIVDTRAFALEDADHRVMYPAFGSAGILTGLLQIVIDEPAVAPRSVTAYFLFSGDGPLRLTVQGTSVHRVTLTPRYQPRLHQRLLRQWWRQYHEMIRRQGKDGDYPPIVETYLSSMLARRLGLAPPLLAAPQPERMSEPQEALELVLGTEKLRQAMMRETLMARSGSSPVANLPVPAETVWPAIEPPEAAEGVEIEPIAFHVPEECFYIRFGSFDNYLWMSRLMKDYGGDISNMVKLRGHNGQLNDRVQRQLALRESALAELVGGHVISDVALMGRDMFLREGAAIAILFEARNALLGTDILNQRAAALAREKDNGATLETVQVSGRDVSFLSTPGNTLRSFYVVQGKYHLVSTSRAIVERFLDTADGRTSLGQLAEFAHARTAMPVSREDTIFVYLSSRFFQGLASPQYQIELRRRMKAVTDIELVKMALLAARGEGQPTDNLDQLVRAKLLPPGFSHRPDASRVVLDGANVTDSLRGQRGTFVPVPDVPLKAITRDEANRYAAFAEFCGSHWQQTDPLMVGIKRWALPEEDRERVAVDAWMIPFDSQQYGLVTSMIGPPSDRRVTPAAGDIVSVQATLRGGLLRPSVDTHQLFFGLQDTMPSQPLPDGPLLRTLQIIRTAPGYLGAWPKPGFLDLLPPFIRGQPDGRGYSQLPLGLWRRQFDGFSVLSFLFPVLETVTPHLQVEQTDDPAQARIFVGDLSRAQMSRWINDLYYKRARQASVGNARFLHTLSQQLGVPRSQARATAEDLLDVTLTCALGGDYRLEQSRDGLAYWMSSAWETERRHAAAPPSYRAPLMDWFRGLNADLSMLEDKLFVHAELDMQRKAHESAVKLPLFNLFGGSQSEKKGDQPPAKQEPPLEVLPEPLPPPPTP